MSLYFVYATMLQMSGMNYLLAAMLLRVLTDINVF